MLGCLKFVQYIRMLCPGRFILVESVAKGHSKLEQFSIIIPTLTMTIYPSNGGNTLKKCTYIVDISFSLRSFNERARAYKKRARSSLVH